MDVTTLSHTLSMYVTTLEAVNINMLLNAFTRFQYKDS